MRTMSSRQRPDRNLALELVRVTEAAALAASRWMGRGDKNGADGAAVEAMRTVLATVPMDGIVVIGEGEKDEAPMLFNGETRRRRHARPLCDVAVDPIDGTTLTALGRGNALVGHRGQRAGHDVQPGSLRLHGEDRRRPGRRRAPSTSRRRRPRTCAGSPRPSGESVRDLTVVILDRERHAELIDEVRSTGARIRLISDGDIYGAIATASPGAGADVLFGIGGTPEGVVAAAALKCMGGEIQGRLWPRDRRRAGPGRRRRLRPRQPSSPPTTWSRATTASSPPPASPTASCCRASATSREGRSTQSLVMRSRSGTVRLITARHRLDKLQGFAAVDYI